MGIYNTDRTCQISLQYGISIYTSIIVNESSDFLTSNSSFAYQVGVIYYPAIVLMCISFEGNWPLFVFKCKFIICINTYIYFPFLNCQDYEFFIVQSSDPGHLGKLPAACHCLLFPLKTILLRPALWVSPK